jgi:peptidoglycan/LPS O-acetylase OafA/YrhL
MVEATAEPDVRAPGDREIKQSGERRLLKVEALRGLLALGVVSAHIWGASGGDLIQTFGGRAVAGGLGFGAFFFFTLSGFLLYIPFVRRDFGGGGGVSIRNYALNRFVRVMPLYYVALIAVLVILHDGGTLRIWAIFGTWSQNFFRSTAGTINGSLWTGVVELHFYILLPLLAYLVGRLATGSIKRAALVIGGLMLASMAFQLFAVLLADKVYRDPLRFSFPANFYFIGAGMMVALAREAWRKRPPALPGPLGSANFWLLAALPLWLAFISYYKLEPLFGVAAFLVLGAIMLPLRPSVLHRVLEWRPLAAFGLASYSVFIWQYPILITINRRHVPVLDPLIAHAQDLLGSSYFGYWVIAAPFICAVAMVSYKLIEEPALRLRRRWGAARKTSVERHTRAATPAPAERPAPG